MLEQNYQFDLLSPQKLLEKYVGRTINVYRTNPQTSVDEAVEAEVVSVNGGTILRIGGEITFNYPGRFSFPELPDNLIAEPTLLWRLDASGGHTPRDEELRIKMGEAFDVVGDRRQMDYTVLSSCVSESTWQIDLRNHKDEDVEVMLVEPVGGDWQILSSTHPFEQTDAWTFTLTPEVEANGETRVEYRVRVRWC